MGHDARYPRAVPHGRSCPAGPADRQGERCTRSCRASGAGTHVVMAGPRRTGKSHCRAGRTRAGEIIGLYTAQVDLWITRISLLHRALAQSIIAEPRPDTPRRSLARMRAGASCGELLPAGVTAKPRTSLGEDVELAWATPAAGQAPGAGLAATSPGTADRRKPTASGSRSCSTSSRTSPPLPTASVTPMC